VPNDRDANPLDPNIGEKSDALKLTTIDIVLIVILAIVLLIIAAGGYAVYTGQVRLPTNAPPEVAMEEKEGGFHKSVRSKREMALEALEDVDLGDMMVCSECGEVVKRDDTECPNCNSTFSDSDEEDSFTAEEEELAAEED
jgi:hypothetical protein